MIRPQKKKNLITKMCKYYLPTDNYSTINIITDKYNYTESLY